MRGSVSWQLREVFSSIAKIGESRHEAKNAARAEKRMTASQLAENTGIYSYATLDGYRSIAADCFSYAKTHYGVKDISKLASIHIESFLRDKTDNGASYNTIKTYFAALGKFETALNSYFQTSEYNFKTVVSAIKSTTEKPESESRAFRDARAVINSMTEQFHKIVATLQYEYGLRVAEASYINIGSQLDGNTLTVQGKGGYMITKELSHELITKINNIAENNIFNVEYSSYLRDLKNACRVNFEDYTGSHAFRHTYAQERYNELIREGMGITEAKLCVSKELGHHRADIVDVYLR